MSRVPLLLAAAMLCLVGCANGSSTGADRSLAEAREQVDAVQRNAGAQASAPKEVVRAAESLERAEQFARYWGGAEDARHFAYLSERYAQIARERAALSDDQAVLQKSQQNLRRLERTLDEAAQTSAVAEEDTFEGLLSGASERGVVLTLGDVLFDTGHSELKPGANASLLRLVRFLERNPQRRIRIEGYTDSIGDAAFNLQLSRARADAVAQLLEDLGIEGNRIVVVGYGDAFPLAENASPMGRAQNRRVEIVFSAADGELPPERQD